MYEQTKNNINKLLNVFNTYQEYLSLGIIDDLTNFSGELLKNVQIAEQDGRDLRIAVVGQMKAGKSSFLNALLFPVDILPKAATPMTAALTRIAYAPNKSYAEIEFYSQTDWQQITNKAQEYKKQYRQIEQQLITEQQENEKSTLFGFKTPKMMSRNAVIDSISASAIQSRISEELRACHELIDLARQLDVNQFLGNVESIEAEDLIQLGMQLNNYVGSTGKFTAITKMFSLYIHDERLKGIEIYDTPGFNDPVISRGTQTRKFLGQCDVVFLLSAVNQFLTKSDLGLLREQLTAAGINSKAVFVIGSQRDLVFRMDRDLQTKAKLLAQQYPLEQRSHATIGAMNHLLDKKLVALTQDTINRHLSDPDIDDSTTTLLEQVQKVPPTQVASICWRMAEHLDDLPPDLQEIYDGLCSDAGLQFKAQELRDFSNIDVLRNMIVAQHSRKQELLKEKVSNLYEGAIQYCQQLQKQALQQIESRLIQLDSTSIEQLKRRLTMFKKKLNDGSRSIEQTLQLEANEIQSKIDFLVLELKSHQQQFADIDVLKTTDIKIEKLEKPGFFSGLARFFGMGGYETQRIEIVTHYAQVQDSIEQIEGFASDSLIQLQKQITTIINMDKLRKRVSNAAIDLFDTEDPDFDLLSFKTQVNTCLEMYKAPQLSISAVDITRSIVSRFGSGEVKQDDIHALKQVHRQALNDVMLKITVLAKEAKANLDQYFEGMQDNLIVSLIDQLDQDLSNMAKQLQDKENSLKQLKAFKYALLSE